MGNKAINKKKKTFFTKCVISLDSFGEAVIPFATMKNISQRRRLC